MYTQEDLHETMAVIGGLYSYGPERRVVEYKAPRGSALIHNFGNDRYPKWRIALRDNDNIGPWTGDFASPLDALASWDPMIAKELHADWIAAKAMNVWGVKYRSILPDEFHGLMRFVFRYSDAKHRADNQREFGFLTEQQAAEEQAARDALIEHYEWLSVQYALLRS